jgi:hypothetical protein
VLGLECGDDRRCAGDYHDYHIPNLVNTSARFTCIRVVFSASSGCGLLGSGGMMCWGIPGGFDGSSSQFTSVPTTINMQPSPVDIVDNWDFNDFVLAYPYTFDRSAIVRMPFDRSSRGLLPPQGLLSNLTLAHGAGFVCGTAALGGATLCLSPQLLFQSVDIEPAGGFLHRPPVVGVPFP